MKSIIDYILKEAITQQDAGAHILDVNVGLTATSFTGVAPKENASQVLQTLLTLSNERTPDEEAFACFMNESIPAL